MRILFITAGLTPLRGQANSYQETLIEKLAERGHHVACLCMAETSARPWMHWTRTAAAPPVYRVFNGGVYPAAYSAGGVGTRRPDLDVHGGSALHRAVIEIVRAEAPDVISVQSLFGLPLSLLSELARLRPAIVVTLHDYFALCPTAHLQREGQRCRLGAADLVCDECCAASPAYPVFWLNRHLDRVIDRAPAASSWRRGLCQFRNGLKRTNRAWNRLPRDSAAYQQRRHAALAALRAVGVVHCISQREAAVVRELAGDLPNIVVLPLHPPSAESRPSARRSVAADRTVRFAALNVHAPYKGSLLLARVFRRLHAAGLAHELHFFGSPIEPPIDLPHARHHGRYRAEDLDRIAAETDFCLVPSLCDETLGFVGMEMLERGVPLMVSSWAGVSEFVEHGVSGFVFDPTEANELFDLLARLIREPELRTRLQAGAAGGRSGLKAFSSHVREMEALFARALRDNPPPLARDSQIAPT